ncbi:uncharacterized protein [Ptychodera flava]
MGNKATTTSLMTIEDAIKDAPSIVCSAMEPLKTNSIFNSKTLPGVAEVKTMATTLCEVLTENPTTVKCELENVVKTLWVAVVAGDRQRLTSSRREAMFRAFHLLRTSTELREHLRTLCQKAGLKVSPPVMMLLARHIFESLVSQRQKVIKVNGNCDGSMSSVEENILRYACGYIPMALISQLQKRGPKFSSMVKCLQGMRGSGQTAATFLSYTTEWVNKENRGGLYTVNDTAYLFFRRVEFFIRKHNRVLLSNNASNIHELVSDEILDDMATLEHWSKLAIGLSEKCSLQLMLMCAKMWINIRGHSTARKMIQEFKVGEGSKNRSNKALRKELKNQKSD